MPPKDPLPFNKWDPDGADRQARDTARAVAAGEPLEKARARAAKERIAGHVELTSDQKAKRWLLRWGGVTATAVMVAGYIIAIIVLTGHGDLIGFS